MKPTARSYSTKIIKSGALLSDTKTLLAIWDQDLSITDNLAKIQHDNVFGKASRARVKDILRIFRQRYLSDISVTSSLVHYFRNGLPANALDAILYFHATQSDALLHDIVTEFLVDLYEQQRTEVSVDDFIDVLRRWTAEGKSVSTWSDPTIVRVAQGLASTLRDFGVLEGAVNKHFAVPHLPMQAFAHVAFYLYRTQPSGERLVNHPEWGLFLISSQAVERLFMEAHQHRLLEYFAAGSVIRITFPATTLEEYANVIVQRAT